VAKKGDDRGFHIPLEKQRAMPTKTTVVRTAATSDGDSLDVKIRCGEDIRRVSLDLEMDLERLMARLTTMFNLDGMNHGGSFRIKYQDDEGDLVSITDDEELLTAFVLAKGWGATVGHRAHPGRAKTPFRMEIFRCPSSPHNRGFPKPKPLNPPIVQVAVEQPVVVQQQGADALNQEEHQDQDQDQDQGHGKDEPQHQETDECQWGHGRHGGRNCGRHGGGRHRGHGWGGHRRGKWGGHGNGNGNGNGFGGRAHGGHGGPQSGSPPWMEGRKSRFISDVTLPDGTAVTPGTKVTKIWKLGNCGSQDWASGTKLLHVGGDSLLERPQEPIVVDPAAANGEVDVAVDLIAPEDPGRYISYFRLCGPRGMRFGQRIWVMLVVADDEDDDSDGLDAALDSDHSSGEQDPLSQQKQQQKLQRQAIKRERQMAKQKAKAEKLATKAEQLAARAAKIKASQQGGKHQDPASLAMMEEKVRHIETKARSFANQAAAIQATMATAVELPEVADMMNQLTPEQQSIVAMAGLTSSQLEAVCAAVATQQHLGIVCDATQQQPIVGVRYTKPSNGDTYDLCQSAFDTLPPEEQEQFEAVPTPDINVLIRAVSGTEEAVPPLVASEPEPEPEPESDELTTVVDDAEGGSEASFELVDGDNSSEEGEKTD